MPGTELTSILVSLRIRAKGACDCERTLRHMDRLGVEGCKRDRHALIPRLRKNAKEYSVGDWMIAGLSAWQRGLALKVNWLDPLPDLFDIAVARAEAKQ